MKSITLRNGMLCFVDDEDFDFLNQWRWRGVKIGRTFYAVRNTGTYKLGTYRVHLMHRVILDARPGQICDHIDRNGLNNQKQNLRFDVNRLNQSNSRLALSNTSGFKGVNWDKTHRLWSVHITHKNKMRTIGYSKDPSEAARLYDREAIRLKGEFACTNQSLGLIP